MFETLVQGRNLDVVTVIVLVLNSGGVYSL